MSAYFDNNATTPPSPEAVAAFTRAATEAFGNPSSIHTPGQQARQMVDTARREVAGLLGCDAKEIVFTSGGTESDNLAILGTAPKHMIISTIEHPAVLAAADEMERRGCEVTRIGVDAEGVVDPEQVRRALRAGTQLISIMHANNETGALQPVREIAAIAREAGALFHSDGVQATGKIGVNVRELGVDLYSISGHKFYAMKGAGALYVRDGVRLKPMQYGGRHERERRAGTENVPGIAALGAAAGWMVEHREAESARLERLRGRFEQSVLERIPRSRVNSNVVPRVPNTSNIAFEGIEGEALVIALDLAGFAVSTGAACSSGAVQASHVLLAMGMSVARAKSSMRFSMGRLNSEADVDALVGALEASVARLRKLSPAYHDA